MKLIKATITNFKGIKDPTTVSFDKFNVVVGQNDAGKSTILKALDCFLNDNAPKPEDLNNKADNQIVSIELYFIPEKCTIVIDENIETTFEVEEILNTDNLLQVKKDWDASKARITSETSVIRKRYNQQDCLTLTEAQLIALCRQLNIQTQKANGDEFNNAEKRGKIREHHLNNYTPFTYERETLPTAGKTRLKSILDNLKKSLPRFEYFKADTSLSETDTAIQNFFKKLTEKTIEEEVDKAEIETAIETKLNEILDKITTKINQVVDNSEAVKPVIKFDWGKLINTTFSSTQDDSPVPLSSRGDGFRRITMMAFFEHLAEQDSYEKQNIIFGFEEPETFLHPSGQEKLFNKLSLMCDNGYQIVISTHSSIIVANTDKENITHIIKVNGTYTAEQNIADISNIAKDLGITVDNQFINLFDKANVLFLVEGIDDATAFQHIASLYKANNLIQSDFSDLEVAIIPVGGCDSIKHWVTLDILNQLGKPYFIFQDSDKTTAAEISPNLTKLTNAGFQEGVHFRISKKRNLENYISAAALNRIVAGAAMAYGDWDNIKDICARHPRNGDLGGRKVCERHFTKLTFAEIRSTFFDGNEDEFILTHQIIENLIPA
jgi:putative ATP-dependent endonuclease of the OLD family